MAETHEHWLEMGISKTVYSLPFDSVEHEIRSMFEEPEALLARHRRPWERKQDSMHDGFKLAWIAFAKKANFDFSSDLHPHFYPCSGASEAIRETLAVMASKGKSLVVFDGEYEGYEAIACGLGMKVSKIQRARWREHLPELWSKGHELFVSNPSGIDGCHWRDFEDCAKLASERGGKIHLDAAYVGSCLRPWPIDSRVDSVASVFFSMSKPFGVYYRRIGGCFTQEPNPLLAGNIWFKNLDSLAIGERLLKKFDPGSLARAAEPAREKALSNLRKKHGWKLDGADVFLLAKGEGHGLEELVRAPGFKARVCLTPTISSELSKT